MCIVTSRVFKKGIKDSERYSIIENEEQFGQRCHKCGAPYPDIHECFGGINRQKSKDYGLCVSLCRKHHDEAHKNPVLRRELEQMGKHAFLEYWGDIEQFKEVFGRYYE